MCPAQETARKKCPSIEQTGGARGMTCDGHNLIRSPDERKKIL
jgi:hypothetical protein